MDSGHVVAVSVGIGIAIQVAIVGRTSAVMHPLAVSFALLMSGVVAAAGWATASGAWADVGTVARSWWWIPLGVGGWVVVAAYGYAANRVGVAAALGLSIGAQIALGTILDTVRHGSSMDLRTLLGIVLIVGGAAVVATSTG